MKRKTKHFMIAAAIFILGLFSTTSVMAAQKSKVTIKPNKTYTSYDVTGNGKKDKFLIKFSPEKYLRIYVNGKRCYSSNVKDAFAINAELCTLKNKKSYLHLKRISPMNDNLVSDVFMTYRSGKFVTSVNTLSHMNRASHGRYESFVDKVGSNYIRIMERALFYDVGIIQYYVTYKQSGYKLIPTGKTYPITYKKSSPYFPLRKNVWTASKDFCSFAPDGNDTFANSIGDKISLYKIRFIDGMPEIYMKNIATGQFSWYICPNEYSGRIFDESVFI